MFLYIIEAFALFGGAFLVWRLCRNGGALYRLMWHDWRIKVVIFSSILAVIVTVAFYYCIPDATDATKFIGAAFASWISGLLLFMLVGLGVAIVSLARPEHELFEARARNLLRRQTGHHIDYMVGRLHDVLEAYTAQSTRKIVVLDYDAAEKMFHTSHTTESILKGYLDDKIVNFPAKISYKPLSKPPGGRQKSCLTFLEVNGEKFGDVEEFDDEVARSFRIQIPVKGEFKGRCAVKHRYLYWIKAEEEENVSTSVRYTRELSVEVENQLASSTIVATIKNEQGPDERIVINPGTCQRVIYLTEITPRDKLYDFRLGLA
ncbi:hypothetical protein [Rhizobium sullae]|uniref:Uncharacterized protein n=1 Tax=Rhizobium sullae TaxID=50338 RepID=A0A4R3QDI6_RHISU|nr:hypothetical protein [Rhizobium sullae]TCU18777.1 hypothetical protein EV132_1022 [Rhizobium sullae]